mmetsp:Transcript_27416/g.88591  ORF Transcript_27416/g.88591 Transcript_27416/m.88591 type:complete len:80 (+) Transcript_27416:71-310(+)
MSQALGMFADGHLSRYVFVILASLALGSGIEEEVLEKWELESCPPTVNAQAFDDGDFLLRQSTTALMSQVAASWRGSPH